VTRAEREAYRLLQELGIEKPPVSVRKIAQQLRVRVVAESLDDPELSAALYRDEKQAVILVNANHSRTRQRFSIAHELGHFRLHRSPIFVDKRVRINFRDSRSALGIQPEEIQANRFAAALLMPEQWVLAEVNRQREHGKTPDDDRVIRELARVFAVSPEAVQHRLANLGVLGTF